MQLRPRLFYELAQAQRNKRKKKNRFSGCDILSPQQRRMYKVHFVFASKQGVDGADARAQERTRKRRQSRMGEGETQSRDAVQGTDGRLPKPVEIIYGEVRSKPGPYETNTREKTDRGKRRGEESDERRRQGSGRHLVARITRGNKKVSGTGELERL